MKLGLNLSFAVKRWMEPEILARMCKEDFGIEHIQFSWDFIDPWWPEDKRSIIAKEFKEAFKSEGVKIDNTFGGNAAYAFPHFLSPSQTQRNIALDFFKRAVDMTLELGTDAMGSPAGALSYKEARDPEVRKARYGELVEKLYDLAAYGKTAGLREIYIEPTPLFTEIPYGIADSIKLMEDVEQSEIPIKLLLDWGHALFKPLLKEEANIETWFKRCRPYVGAIHLQQTDGMWDRHWDFAHEGIVSPELILDVTKKSGLEDIYQYLEVVTIYEDSDDAVYERMKYTMDYLHQSLSI